MDITEANKIFRKSIIKGFFEETLLTLDFKKSNIKHPNIAGDGLMQSLLLHIFFDVDTGLDYPDGDEWFITDFLFPYEIKFLIVLLVQIILLQLVLVTTKIFGIIVK